MLLVCIAKIIIVFYLPKIVERKQRKCTNIITDNISILFYGFVNEVFFPKTLKFTATYLERSKAYQLTISVLFYILICLYFYWIDSSYRFGWASYPCMSSLGYPVKYEHIRTFLFFFFWHNLLSAVWYNKNKVFAIHYC